MALAKIASTLRLVSLMLLVSPVGYFCVQYMLIRIFNHVGRFIVSPQFAALHRRFGKPALDALERSLNVQDRITALIRKQRILNYPEGTSLAGKFAASICLECYFL